MIKNLFLIGIGGFVGSIFRYFVSRINLQVDFFSIPAGTFLVNILGSFLIGFLVGISERSALLTIEWRLFLMVGLCGGFTTFSTFTSENLMLLRNGQLLSVFLYTGGSILFGFTAVYFGYISTKLM
jgi:fluoride exporter